MTAIMHNNEPLIDDILYCSEYVQQLKPQKCENTSCLCRLNIVFQAKLTCSSPIQFEKRLYPNAESLQLLLLQKKKLELREVNEQCWQINSPLSPGETTKGSPW